MDRPFLKASADASASGASASRQVGTLLRRKELPLKMRRPITSVCEALLPVVLCGLVLLSKLDKSQQFKVEDTTYIQDSYAGAAATLGPQALAEAVIASQITYEDLRELLEKQKNATNATGIPNAIFPLALYLSYAANQSLSPFDGTFLAVTPDTPAVRALLNATLQDADGWPHEEVPDKPPRPPRPPASPPAPGQKRPLLVRYFGDEDALEKEAVKGMAVWCALVFDDSPPVWPTPASWNWTFTLRYNHTEVPSTREVFDKFTPGLSTKYTSYYASGFLSLQTALSSTILCSRTHDCTRHSDGSEILHEIVNRTLGGFVYAAPYPVPAYANNRFLNHAGPLIGLVIVLSFLIPLATMLRALVLEKESKLREGLLMSGLSLSAYYASIFLTYGATFLLCALLGGALITPTIFPLSNPLLVMLLFVLFALAVLAFTATLSAFFRNARVASILGPLSLFLSSQLIFLFLDRQTGVLLEGMVGAKGLASLLPAMGFYLGVSRLALYEGAEQAVSFATLFDGDFSFGASLVLLTFDIFLWSFLAWYFDQVLPSEYGLQRPCYFVCSPSYWCPFEDDDASMGAAMELGGGTLPLELSPSGSFSTQAIAVEEDNERRPGEGVNIVGLRKVFKRGPNNGVAVAGLHLSMRPGQITSLLGANGAGKTTSISMLTGLIPPTAGDAWIGPHSVRTEMRQIRTSLGVCPQQNVLFEAMTPREHLLLHGELKGIPNEQLSQRIRDMLTIVGLGERMHTPSAALSGGQKRKLCLAIALLGGPSTCFLDEPTSGMDPHSRRSIWALLRNQREGRTLVLTTHFLDEAEILSDRIAIMAEGNLRCVGSPLFLKARLGCGYRLTVSKATATSPAAPRFDAAALLALLRTYDPNAEITADERFYAEANLPSGSIAAFASLFSALDGALSNLAISEYGLTCTTLEDVFLKINQNNLDRLDKLRNKSSLVPPSPPQPERRATAMERAEAGVLGGDASSAMQEGVGAAAAAAALVAAEAEAEEEAERAGRNTSSVMRGGSAFGQCAALVTKRRLQAQRDVCATCCQLLFPVLLVFLALKLLTFNLQDTGPRIVFDPTVALGASHAHLAIPHPPAVGETPVAWVGRTPETTANLTGYLEAQGWEIDDAFAANISEAFPAVAVDLSNRLMSVLTDDRSDPTIPPAALSLAYTDPFKLGPIDIPSLAVPTLMFQSKQLHALPTLLNSLYDARLRQASGGAQTLGAATHPLPRTKDEEAKISVALSAFASIMILIPFAFVAASFVTPHVRERESGSKSMQYVSGVGNLTYWLASWIWDALLYCLVLICTLAVFLLMNRHEFTGTLEATGATAALLAAFGAAAIGFASVASFGFTTPSTALLLMIAFHFLSGFALVIADTIFLIVGGSAYEVDRHLRSSLYPLFPAFCLGRGLIVLSTRDEISTLHIGGRAPGPPPPLYGWSWEDQLGSPITFMLCEALASCALTLVLQLLSSRPQAYQALFEFLCCTAKLKPPRASTAFANSSTVDGGAGPSSSTRLEDESVLAERAAVDALSSTGASTGGVLPLAASSDSSELVLRHLKKQYGGVGGKLAVRDLCLRVHAGECFGFLGVNGAGKSTTFAMLTGATLPSSGDASLRGLSILSQQDDLRKLVGFCPQHDALEALLTPRETLRLYARIKGVPAQYIEEEVEGLLVDLDLKMFDTKRAGTLSGGNKRKLCVAIALIGSPQLVLLDEPSSGMDAASKRFLWAVIKRRTAACSTILTTHSMEECEALCGRIGVMVDGALRCLGPIQSLKSRYGQGYKLDLRLNSTEATDSLHRAESVVAAVAEGCPGAKLEEAEPPCLTLTLPQRRGVSLADIFAHLAVVCERCGVLETSLSQCTLEQVFLLMASKQSLRSGGEEATD